MKSKKSNGISCWREAAQLLPWKNVADNIAWPLRLKAIPKEEAFATALIWLERVGLSEHARLFPYQLSSETSQRVALARAFVARPDVLLLDESFSNIEASQRERLETALLALQAELGTSIIYTSAAPKP